MRRRDLMLLAGGPAFLQALGSAAQQSLPVVGCLFIGDPGRSDWWLDAWRKGLAESGFVEGRNFAVEFRWAGGDQSRLPGFAADLAARRVAVIVATTLPAVEAARRATTTIPIVFSGISDPVGMGLVKSIAQPGGNITGIANEDSGAMEAKRLQLLHEFIPAASRIGYLFVDQDSGHRRDAITAVVAAGQKLGVEIVAMTADRVEEIDPAFARARQLGVGAVLVQAPSTFLYAQQKLVVEAAARHASPIASGNVQFVRHGGLMEYNAAISEMPRLAGLYVARILKGQNPGELPVQHATRTRLAVNLKSAKALGIAVPPALLARADEIIE